MKIELRIGGRTVQVEAEGPVCVRVAEEEGAGRFGAEAYSRLARLRREFAEAVAGPEPEEPEETGAATPGAAGEAAPGGWDEVFSAAEGAEDAPCTWAAVPPEEAPAQAAGEAPAPGADLFTRLSALRRALAAERNVPPYVVFLDRTLREMAEKRPQDLAALSSISGVGKARLEKYGEAFLSVISEGVAA
jgi:superfamily II DNA helicase RecQ